MTLSRRRLLTGAAALATLAACTRGSEPTRPSAIPEGPVRTQLQAVAEAWGQGREVGVCLTDRRTGETFSHGADLVGPAGGVTAVLSTLAALARAREGGTELTFVEYGHVSRAVIAGEDAEVTTDAMDALWGFSGGAGPIADLAGALGMAATTADPADPSWAAVRTTAADLLRLGTALVDGNPALHDEDRLYTLDLLAKNGEENAWGIGTPSSDDVEAAVRGGLVRGSSADSLACVTSFGHVSGAERDYVAALVVRTHDTDQGRSVADGLGADLFAVLARELS